MAVISDICRQYDRKRDNDLKDEKKEFHLTEEAREKIDTEFSDVDGSFKRSVPPVSGTGRRNKKREKAKAQQVQPVMQPKPMQHNTRRRANPADPYGTPQDDMWTQWGQGEYHQPAPQPMPEVRREKKKHAKSKMPQPMSEAAQARAIEKKESRRLKRLWKWFIRALIFFVIVMAIDIAALMFSGKLRFNEPKKRDYPVRGPVVTDKMGSVNWSRFVKQNFQMAYIRATKSTTYVDSNFEKNKKGSAKTNLPTGFLHEFDISMDGEDQAKHFIETVGDMDGRIIPCVDITRRGVNALIPVDYDKAADRLRKFIDAVEAEYDTAVIIKCDKKTYEKIAVKDEFDDSYIWYLSEYSKPDEEVEWDMWTYSERMKFNFYESKGFLEMAIFNGSEEDFGQMYIDHYW